MRFGLQSGIRATRSLRVPTGTQQTVSVDGSSTFQTMVGMGFNVNSAAWDSGNFAQYLTMGVQTCGATRWRVVIDEAIALEPSNDDSDPSNYNWTVYDATFSTTQFENLWNTIAHLNSLGVSEGITVCIMGRSPTFMGQPLTTTTAIKNEWAEMTAAMVYYGLVRRSPPVTFGYYGPNNEMDWDEYEGTQMLATTYGDCMGRLADRLTALGLTNLKFGGPDCSGVWQNENYLLQYTPSALARVATVSGHSYSSETAGMDDASTVAGGVPWGMSELGDFDQAYSAIVDGASFCELWEYSDSVYNHAIRRDDNDNPPNDQLPGFPAPISYNGSTYGVRDEFYQWAHLCKHIRPGCVRVACTAGGNITALAFKHVTPNTVTIMGKNSAASVRVIDGTLTNCPAVQSLHVYATNGTSLQHAYQGSVDVVNGRFYASIPASSIFTLTSVVN